MPSHSSQRSGESSVASKGSPEAASLASFLWIWHSPAFGFAVPEAVGPLLEFTVHQQPTAWIVTLFER